MAHFRQEAKLLIYLPNVGLTPKLCYKFAWGKPMKTFELSTSILGYREEEDWVALALEMDIRGYGKTFEEAVSDLVDLITMQVRFALSRNQPNMIFRPAEGVWFQRFTETRRAQIESMMKREPESEEGDYYAVDVPFPHPSVINKALAEFSQVSG